MPYSSKTHDLKVVKNLNTLKSVGKAKGWKFNNKFKYFENTTDGKDYSLNTFEHNGRNYMLKFADGCFNPYLFEIIEKNQ